MIEGTRKITKGDHNFEIIFGIQGDKFHVQHVISQDQQVNVPDEVIKEAVDETEEVMSTWAALDEEDYTWLNTHDIEIFA